MSLENWICLFSAHIKNCVHTWWSMYRHSSQVSQVILRFKPLNSCSTLSKVAWPFSYCLGAGLFVLSTLSFIVAGSVSWSSALSFVVAVTMSRTSALFFAVAATPHYTTLYYTTLHCTTLHYTTLQYCRSGRDNNSETALAG